MVVELEHTTYNELPDKFEAGTPDAGGAIALGVAVDYLTSVGMDKVRAHEHEITDYALEVMMGIEDVALYGPKSADARGAVVAFNFADIHPHDLGTLLDRDGVAIRAGHHCCQPLMRRLGQVATARASFYLYNTREEVDALADALGRARTVMYGSKRN
jgi:cysteine desulfurase / selenocysteine lyase